MVVVSGFQEQLAGSPSAQVLPMSAFFLSLAAIPLARASHMLKPGICAGGDHPRVWSQGDMYKLGPFLQPSVTGLYMLACVCVCAVVTIIDGIITFSP